MEENKYCKFCNSFKKENDFYIYNNTKCKICIQKTSKEYKEKNKEKIKIINANWSARNKDKNNKASKKYRQQNLEKSKQAGNNWKKNNPEKSRSLTQKWREGNKEKIQETNIKWKQSGIKYKKDKRAKDPAYRIFDNLSSILISALKKYNLTKTIRTYEILGCNSQEWKIYLESLFEEGMTWDNHGYGPGTWQIDHIIPKNNFKIMNEEEQKKCFHYTNTQPLWWEDNRTKGDKLNWKKDPKKYPNQIKKGLK